MGRLQPDFLERVELFCHRVVDVAGVLDDQRRSRRIVDQLTASGTSVGANLFEADEALSRKDFCKTLGIVVKELNETRFWLRFAERRGWVAAERLLSLHKEAEELKRISGAIISKTRNSDETGQ